MISFYSASPRRLDAYLLNKGLPQIHLNALYSKIYGADEGKRAARTALPQNILSRLSQDYTFELPKIEAVHQSKYDGTVKFLIKLFDGNLVETVLMPESSRLTLCVSSQAGCRQACSFCHTGRMGLRRNLEAGEIISQFLLARQWIEENPAWINERRLIGACSISNIVFMGMGEPLDNTSELVEAISTMIHPKALGIAPRRITVSTAGHLDGLKVFLSHKLGTSIALSLHTADLATRSKLMPINRRYPVTEVLDFLRAHQNGNKSHVLIQYTVISDVNDSEIDAQNLIDLLKGIRTKVNLIPLNPIRGMRFNEPAPERLRRFQNQLFSAGIRTMIRYSKGQDISAACGQLVVKAT